MLIRLHNYRLMIEHTHWTDAIPRFLAVGIFLIENFNHIMYFSDEVQSLVGPAISPLPTSLAYFMHAVTVALGLTGSTLFLMSGFKKSGSTSFVLGVWLLALFMILITWNWWFRRYGQFVWEVADDQDRKMRIIHCLKNLSIFGFLLTCNALVSKRSKSKRR